MVLALYFSKNSITMKTCLSFVLTLALSTTIGIYSSADAQTPAVDAVIQKLKLSLKSGNSKELASSFQDMVEVTLPDAESNNYSKTQAEFVLRDFMKKYPPVDFKYIHKVLDPEDYKFVIGEYLYNGGKYRVTMVIKPSKGAYFVDSIVFEK
jgi:Na+-transporting NADH:ubiquinone oxidoreductase subunit NqrC